MKPQGLIVLPVLFFELVFDRYATPTKKASRFCLALIYAIITTSIIAWPFSKGQSSWWLINLYRHTTSGYQYASVNAFNLFALIGGNWLKDSQPFLYMTYYIWGIVFIALITLFTAFLYWHGRKSDVRPLLTGLILVFGVFVFSSRMHERYLFPAIILALMAYVIIHDKRLLWIYTGISLTSFINVLLVLWLVKIKLGNHLTWPYLIMWLVSLGNLFLFCFSAKVSFDLITKNDTFPQSLF